VHDQVRRYVEGAAAAVFVIVWATLGFEVALFAALAGAAASQWRRLTLPRRTPAPRRRRIADGDDLPLVPDDPSLILTPAEL
jgi:hypothetical protein